MMFCFKNLTSLATCKESCYVFAVKKIAVMGDVEQIFTTLR